jgi:hypothetical protein
MLSRAFAAEMRASKRATPRLDSLADGLTLLALHSTGPGVNMSGIEALAVLGAAVGSTAEFQYYGAFSNVARIAHEADNVAMRGTATSFLVRFGLERAMPVWRKMAVGPAASGSPATAVGMLCAAGGAEGKRILRQLFDKHSVVDEYAAYLVGVMIHSDFKLGCGAGVPLD